MEDDNSKDDVPSTSKKENQRANNSSDIDDKRDDGPDSRLDSETSATSSGASINSRVEKANNNRLKVPKLPLGKVESKVLEKKKKGKQAGRVEKRPAIRRQAPRKMYKRRPQRHINYRKRRDPSISTVFTRLSSGSGCVSPPNGCMYCGHRCCRRRFREQRKQAFRKRRKARFRRKMKVPKRIGSQKRGSECLQVGSKCLMLSALCINTNAAPVEQTIEEPLRFNEVTPEMLYQSVRKLTMWRQEVTTISILEYMKRTYPVCQDIPALFEEIAQKLHVAALAGIVTQTPMNNWRLSCALQNRWLTKNHVTLFWKTYADTMTPVVNRKPLVPPDTTNKQELPKPPTKTTSIARFSNDYI